MTKYTVTFEYKVTLPEGTSREFNRLAHEWWEEEGQYDFDDPEYPKTLEGWLRAQEVGANPGSTDPERIQFANWALEQNLAYYVIEVSHAGNLTDYVELVHDEIDGDQWTGRE